MLNLKIKDEEIDWAESLLLPAQASFFESRRQFIRTSDSCDVQACPGSGKTTALIAKLLILSQKLPLPENRAICVLTHTNIAVDEIKSRFGKHASQLFQYPNFIGTIQSFVNKFLAIPAYVQRFNKRPLHIDDNQFKYALHRDYGVQGINKAKYALQEGKIAFESLRFSFNDFDIVTKSLERADPFFSIEKSKSYLPIKQQKTAVCQAGYLCYDDAYALGNWYLQNFPSYAKLIQQRFAYVLIDEMQDTAHHQNQILDTLFSGQNVCLQRVGDLNQAIFQNHNQSGDWQKQAKCLSINGSKRFSPAIANAIRNLGAETQDLTGEASREQIRPVAILFEDAQISQVIDAFKMLILQHRLHETVENPKFKMVGATGKAHNEEPDSNDSTISKKHRIYHYSEKYRATATNKNQSPETLVDFLKSSNQNDANSIYSSLTNAILYLLRVNDKKNSDERAFTKTSLFKFLQFNHPKTYDSLKENLAKWTLRYHEENDDDLLNDIREYISKNLFSKPLDTFEEFFGKSKLNTNVTVDQAPSDCSLDEILVEVNTIHGVKGEDHTATLYVETFNNGYDINSLVDLLDISKRRPKKLNEKRMRLAYVAMSRPTHLLCIALHKNTLGRRNKQITHTVDSLRNRIGANWDVREVSEILEANT